MKAALVAVGAMEIRCRQIVENQVVYQVDAHRGCELRMPSRPSFLTNPNTSLRNAFAREPRAPFEDKTKSTNKALRARVAALIRGLRIFLISASRRGASTQPRMSSPRLRMAETPARQVTDTSTRTHTRQRDQIKQAGPPGAEMLLRPWKLLEA